MLHLTEKEQAALRELSRFHARWDMYPTLRELGNALGVTRTPAKLVLDSLERKGAITFGPRTARGYRAIRMMQITAEGRSALEEPCQPQRAIPIKTTKPVTAGRLPG